MTLLLSADQDDEVDYEEILTGESDYDTADKTKKQKEKGKGRANTENKHEVLLYKIQEATHVCILFDG